MVVYFLYYRYRSIQANAVKHNVIYRRSGSQQGSGSPPLWIASGVCVFANAWRRAGSLS